MSTVNILAREVAAKIVFYGPGLSGKTTTLKKIHDSVKPAHRGEMMSLPTEADRTLFFDFLPVKVERIGDCAVRLALYTVPGQVFYNATRKLVLQGADGVVFVADSQPEAMDQNIESLKNLEENLLEQGIRLERFPFVIQFNKRDLAKALPVDEMRRMLNPRSVPDFETAATSGRGVIDALKAITRLVIKDLRHKRVVPASRSAAPAVPALGGDLENLEEQIQQHIESRPPLAPQPSLNSPGTRPPAPPEREGSRAPARPAAVPAPRPSSAGPVSTRLSMGPVAALAPSALLDYAKTADMAFVSRDYEGCVRACREAVQRGLAYAGDSSPGAQAYLLGVSGRDLLKFQQLESKPDIRVDDAAFALFLLMQVLIRLSEAGLTPTE